MRNNRGFSLIETLVAGGILGGMALVGIKLFESQNRGQKQVESNYEIVNIVQSQRQLLSSVNNCTESFRGISPSAGTASTLKQFRSTPAPGFQDKFTVGQPIINQIKVTNYELVKLNIPVSELETFVRVTFARGRHALAQDSSKLIRVAYTEDASGNIATCYAVISTVNTFWLQSSTDPSDIFYNGGDVGIGPGMGDPQHQLDVVGTVRVTLGSDSMLLNGLTMTGSAPMTIAPGLNVTGALASGNVTSSGSVTAQSASLSAGLTAASANFSADARADNLVATSSVQSPSFQYVSDASLKTDVQPLESALKRIAQLEGVSFRWKNGTSTELGFIAQDVGAHEPALVGETPEGLSTVKYGNVTALLVEAVKELGREVRELREQNHRLESELKALKKKR